jgi:hypothetical protein
MKILRAKEGGLELDCATFSHNVRRSILRVVARLRRAEIYHFMLVSNYVAGFGSSTSFLQILRGDQK